MGGRASYTLIVTDYSAAHFGPFVPAAREGKFIIIEAEGVRHMVMAPRGFKTFHANIAEEFFNALGIAGHYNHKRDHYTVSHPGWRILGGGHWRISGRRLELTGESMAYGRFASDGLAEAISATEFGSALEIEID